MEKIAVYVPKAQKIAQQVRIDQLIGRLVDQGFEIGMEVPLTDAFGETVMFRSLNLPADKLEQFLCSDK